MDANTNLHHLIGEEVVDPGGHRVGRVTQIATDPKTLKSEWLVVKTSVFGRLRLLPLDRAIEQGDGHILISYERKAVLDAPVPELPSSLAASEQAALLRHYQHRGAHSLRS